MKAYSTDLREKIALAYAHNDYTLDDVAELFDVGRRTVARFVQMRRAGLSLAPRPHAGGYPTALTAETLSTLRDKVIETPDATLAELVSYLKTEARVRVHLSTVCRALQRLGLPRKKRRLPPTKEMKKNVSPSGGGWRAWIAAS
jgi:transposase